MQRRAYPRDLAVPFRENFLSEAIPTIRPIPEGWCIVRMRKFSENASARALPDMM
jgi:hypothetical protein